MIVPHRAGSEQVVYDIADVYPNGTVAWGKSEFRTLGTGTGAPGQPFELVPFDKEHAAALFFMKFLAPDRLKGQVAVGYQPNNFSGDATQAWQYLPGLRRVLCTFPWVKETPRSLASMEVATESRALPIILSLYLLQKRATDVGSSKFGGLASNRTIKKRFPS